jgi:hypothetical protein
VFPLQQFTATGDLLSLAVTVLVGLTVIAAAVYIGVLRALDVYFDDDQDSVFLSDSGRD